MVLAMTGIFLMVLNWLFLGKCSGNEHVGMIQVASDLCSTVVCTTVRPNA